MRRKSTLQWFLVALLIAHAAQAEPRDLLAEFYPNGMLYDTTGHPKSHGAHFTIRYPANWAASEGNRPHIIQKFNNPSGSEMVMLLVVPLPPVTSSIDLSSYGAQQALLREMAQGDVVPPGAILLSLTETKIETRPALLLHYTQNIERVGIRAALEAMTLVFILDQSVVQVQGVVGGAAGRMPSAAEQMKHFKPQLLQTFNSIVIPGQWTQAHEEKPAFQIEHVKTNEYDRLIQADESKPRFQSQTQALAPAAPTNNRDLIQDALLYGDTPSALVILGISFIVTWVLGLTPAVLVRYVVVRRPIEHKAATWIAAAYCTLFWLAFQAINTATEEKSGTGFVWVLVFFMARWIMTRRTTKALKMSS